MKITLPQLRRIIKEEVASTLLETELAVSKLGVATPLKVSQAITNFTSNPRQWNMARNDIANMAMGGDADGVREQFYSGWTNEDFKALWVGMGQDLDDL